LQGAEQVYVEAYLIRCSPAVDLHKTLTTGPSPGFSSRGGQKPKGGAKNHKRATFLKYSIGCIQQPGSQTWNGGAPISNGGPGTFPTSWGLL